MSQLTHASTTVCARSYADVFCHRLLKDLITEVGSQVCHHATRGHGSPVVCSMSTSSALKVQLWRTGG